MASNSVNPLTWNVAITDPNTGFPTPEFQRKWLQQRSVNDVVANIGLAKVGKPGLVAPDGTTITITSQGVISATAQGANPTATASDVAVNGTSPKFMRSDAAPAVQKTSAAQFGLCKVDGTTITATGGVITAVGGGGGGPPTTAYWDYNNGAVGGLIQGDFFTFDTPGSPPTTYGSQVTHQGQTAGKLYFEIHEIWLPGLYGGVGIYASGWTTTMIQTTFVGDNVNSWGIDNNGGAHVMGGGSSSGAVPSFGTGDVIGVAVDFTGGTIKFYKNNVLGNTITVTLTGLTLYPAVAWTAAGKRMKLCTTAGNCTYSPPGGYSNWN